jgi:hypothetical protein
MSDPLDLGATIRGFSAGQKLFGRYELARMLGRGGMGVVWLAKDLELGRETALKFLPELVAMDPNAIGDMKREVRRAIDLAHPNIVKIHDFVTDGRTAAVSMEYVNGHTLAALRQEKPAQVFATGDLLPWLKQLCAALDYAHADAQVVHRDLKAANLMVDARGRLKVLDFGIAASISDSVSRVSNQGSSGTPVYMSPQQMMGEDPAVTDDVYSVGATLYELLTGKPPFHSGNIILQVQSKVPPRLNERRKTLGLEPVPAAWEDVIAACLEKEPALRPRTAGEIFDRLSGNAPAASLAVKAAPAAPAEANASAATVEPAFVPAKSDSALATLLAVVLAGCGLAPVWFVLGFYSYRLDLPDGLPQEMQILVSISWMVAAAFAGTRVVTGHWQGRRSVVIAAVFVFTQFLYTGFWYLGYYPKDALFHPEGGIQPFAILPASVLGAGVALLAWGRGGGISQMVMRATIGLAAGTVASISLIFLPKHLEGQPIISWSPDLVLPLAGFAVIWWRLASAPGSRPVTPRSLWLHATVALLAAAAATGVLMTDWHRGYYYLLGVRDAAAWRECIYYLLWGGSAFGLGAMASTDNGGARRRWLLAGAVAATLGLLFRLQWRGWDATLFGSGLTLDDTGAPSHNDPGNIVLFFFGPATGLLILLATQAWQSGWRRALAILLIGVLGGGVAWATGWIPGGISSEAAESAPTWFALLALGFTAYAATWVGARSRPSPSPESA